MAVAVLVTTLGAVLVVRPSFAHGFGQRYDLPVPLWLWVSGAALAVALSFVVMGLFIRGTPGLHGYPRSNLLRWRLGRLLAHPAVTTTAEALGLVLLALVVVTGIAGSQNPSRNPAPTLVWVLWWVGFAYISALIGNLWALVNPWSTLFAWAEALLNDPDRESGPRPRYPKRLGVWPAVALFLAFAWVELVFAGRALPANLALLAVGYSLVTWTGMALFGRAVWLAHGDPFALAFGVLARFSPTEVRVTDAAVCRTCPLDCRDRQGECAMLGAEVRANAALTARQEVTTRTRLERGGGGNLLLYHGNVELPAAGAWRVLIEAGGPDGSGSAAFELDVRPPLPIAWPIAIGLAALSAGALWWARTRRRARPS